MGSKHIQIKCCCCMTYYQVIQIVRYLPCIPTTEIIILPTMYNIYFVLFLQEMGTYDLMASHGQELRGPSGPPVSELCTEGPPGEPVR